MCLAATRAIFLGVPRATRRVWKVRITGIGPDGGDRGHVQNPTHRGPAAPDHASSLEWAAVAVEGRDPDQGRRGTVGQPAEFGQFRRQDTGDHEADAGDTHEELDLSPPEGMPLHNPRRHAKPDRPLRRPEPRVPGPLHLLDRAKQGAVQCRTKLQ